MLRVLRIRDGDQLSVTTAAWNLLRPHRIEWRELRAIRLRVRSYSNGEAESSAMLDARGTVELKYLGAAQLPDVDAVPSRTGTALEFDP